MQEKTRAPRNRTITLLENEIPELKGRLVSPDAVNATVPESFLNRTINADLMEALPRLPDEFADLIIIDPPYNLTRNFNGLHFNARSEEAYDEYLASWFPQVCKKLKPTGSLYICGDWKCTSALQRAVQKELTILNRITWQREKGRGAKSNWKNGMEDIWFAVKNPDDYYFADGSGVSLYNYASPQLLVSLLRYAYKKKSIYNALLPSLPRAGEDGTLANRMTNSLCVGRIQAKTGTVTGVSTLSGYATTRDGRRLCFSIMCQGQRKARIARDFQDQICAELIKSGMTVGY